MRKSRQGLTMIELLVVIAILAVLIVLALWGWQNQAAKARDAKRKADLKEYSVIFEDYYNDNDAFPVDTALDSCFGQDLDPYLNEIACDPLTEVPYDYIVGPGSSWYAICAELENETDPAVVNGGCSGGCGTDADYNYCIAEGISIDQLGGSGGGTGGGTDPFPGPWACDPNGVCNSYADPEGSGCPLSFATPDCENLCGIPSNRCPI